VLENGVSHPHGLCIAHLVCAEVAEHLFGYTVASDVVFADTLVFTFLDHEVRPLLATPGVRVFTPGLAVGLLLHLVKERSSMGLDEQLLNPCRANMRS
jgi:hypothetical protein